MGFPYAPSSRSDRDESGSAAHSLLLEKGLSVTAASAEPLCATRLTWAVGGSNGGIADEEVEIFGSALRTQVTARTSSSRQERRLVGDTGAPSTGTAAAAGRAFCRDGGREDEGRRIIASETWRRVRCDEERSVGRSL